MAFTNSTPNYGLPQWVADDKPTYLVDQNGAYLTIDTNMKAIDGKAQDASTTATSAKTVADAAQETANNNSAAIVTITNSLGTTNGDIATLKTKLTPANYIGTLVTANVDNTSSMTLQKSAIVTTASVFASFVQPFGQTLSLPNSRLFVPFFTIAGNLYNLASSEGTSTVILSRLIRQYRTSAESAILFGAWSFQAYFDGTNTVFGANIHSGDNTGFNIAMYGTVAYQQNVNL